MSGWNYRLVRDITVGRRTGYVVRVHGSFGDARAADRHLGGPSVPRTGVVYTGEHHTWLEWVFSSVQEV